MESKIYCVSMIHQNKPVYYMGTDVVRSEHRWSKHVDRSLRFTREVAVSYVDALTKQGLATKAIIA